MKLFILVILFSILSSQNVSAQKRALDHNVYDKWGTIGGFQLTENGEFATYYRNVEQNDNEMGIIDLKSSKTIKFPRANRVKITKDGKYLTYTLKPFFKEKKEARIKKYKGDKIPQDTLAIVAMGSDKIIKYPYLKSTSLSKEGSEYLAFQLSKLNDSIKRKPQKGEGLPLLIYDFKKESVIDTLKYVTSYTFDKMGKNIIFKRVPNSKDSTFSTGLYSYCIATQCEKAIIELPLKADLSMPKISDNEKIMTFYANSDITKKFDDNVEIYIYKEGDIKATRIIDNTIKTLPKGWRVSKNRALQVSDDNSRLFFGITPILQKKDTSLIESECAKLDIWHYNDDYIQPKQLRNVNLQRKKSYISYISLNEPSKLVQLGTPEHHIVITPLKGDADWGFSISSERYAVQSQWDANPIRDLYVISLKDGSSTLIQKGEYISAIKESPEANFITWYNNEKRDWFAYNVETKEINNITKKISAPLYNELHDSPQMAGSYGNGGWREGDKSIFIYDKYDVWEIDPNGIKAPISLTKGEGRERGLTFRILRTDHMQLPAGTPGIKKDPIKSGDDIYFTAFSNRTKGNGYFLLKAKGGALKELILEDDYSLAYLNRAKNANVITFTKSNFATSPDLWITRDLFKTSKRLTDVNPQQKEYNWGTCELINWKSKDGKKVEGLLYKPEDFDSTKEYPMVVYFYEKSSQYKNVYRKPAVSRSTINITFFTSNGYLVMMPDIHYVDGHPGQSAMNCIMPGVEMLCKKSWVDRDNIAIQGQSWGGYQVAYMITQTDKFKAAGAGAPVANMTSAYGGLRLGSGVVRQFQYEHTQSRIGKTMWDKGGLDLYIENSPLFFADKVTTPLLIMNNDNDEAVPWQQGIEYFTALRRLGKKAWMLQYNKESHNISGYVNALDYTKRLSQFFDHLLKGAPEPVWMKYGVPATKKGIDWGLDLVE